MKASRGREAGKRASSHLVLLGLVLICLLAALLLHGYVHSEVGSASTYSAGAPAPSVDGSGPILDLSHSDPRSLRPAPHQIALTFDDGPDKRWTPQILSVLARNHVPATFFVVGARAAEHTNLVQDEAKQGDAVGLHTFTHTDLSTVPRWRANLEVSLAQLAIAGATAHTTQLIRPPYSSTPDAIRAPDLSAYRWLANNGYLTVLADHDSDDWRRQGVGRILKAATPAPGQGEILLMHDAGGDRSETVAALKRLIPELKAQGDQFLTVPQMVGADAGPHASQVAARASWVPASHGDRILGRVLFWLVRFSDWCVGTVSWLLLPMGALAVARAIASVTLARSHARREAAKLAASHARPLSPGDLPPVTVVVPAYNEEVGIGATVRTLLASDYPDLDVIVIDDGSTDSTAARAREAGGGDPRLRVVSQPNGGKPTALNAGIAMTQREVVILVDGDTVFEPATAERLVAPFVADSRVGAVSGNTKVGNRRSLLGLWQHIEYVIGFNLDRRAFDVLQCIATVPGAVGAFRREALEAVGGVPDDTLAEDTDLTMAIVRSGRYVLYQDDARAWTETPGSIGALWRQRYRWSYGTMQAMWKHRHAVLESGPFGRVALPYLLLFQVLLPMLAPVIDLWALYGVVFLDAWRVLAVWVGFMALQMALGAYAFRLDREKFRALWALPLQQFVYRQLMYLVVIQSVGAAVQGQRLRWHKLRRVGVDMAASAD